MAAVVLGRAFALALELGVMFALRKQLCLLLEFDARYVNAQLVVLSAFALGASIVSRACSSLLGGLASAGEGALGCHLGDVVDTGFLISLRPRMG
jgi:hypothetical protein